MASTATNVCNLALNMIPSAGIASLDEQSTAARYCGLEYPQALAEMLELADWGFGRQLLTLTQAENDRQGEWAYAYAIPPQVAFVIRVFQSASDQASSGLLAGQLPAAYDRIPLIANAFLVAATRLYTNVPSASMEFIAEAAVSRFSASFTRALAAKIAQRVVLSITKDERKKQARDQEAELLVARALSIEINKRPGTYGDDFIPDFLAARSGMFQ